MTDTALVIGANGGIGQAVVNELLQQQYSVVAISRKSMDVQHPKLQCLLCDSTETDIDSRIQTLTELKGRLSRIVIATGVLHQAGPPTLAPEKRLEDIDPEQLMHSTYINTVLPAMWVAKLLPLIKGSKGSPRCVIAALSARVGSIGDNRLGGWYSYRSSKAALNMFLKTAAIEYSRRAKNVKLLAFHPGTTDTTLSQPFQANVPEGKLFTPEFVAQKLVGIMDKVPVDGELSYLDWQGESIEW